MADFSMSITHVFAPNTIIASAQMNTNLLNDIRDKYNSMLNGATGHTHDGSTGNGPKIAPGSIDLAANYPWTGIHSWQAGEAQIGGAGAGKAALQYANSATNRTLTIPDPGAAADFVMTEGPQTVNGAKTFNSTISANGAVALDLVTNGNRIDLDADNDTSIRCTADDIIAIEVGGSDLVTLNATSANFTETIQANDTAVAIDLMATGNRIDLDTDNDTSIRCTADDFIVIELGGVDKVAFYTTGELELPDVDPPTPASINRNSTIAGRVRYDDGTAFIIPNFNVANVVDEAAAGVYTITWDEDINSSEANGTVSLYSDDGFAALTSGHGASTVIRTFSTAGVATDKSFEVIIAGVV